MPGCNAIANLLRAAHTLQDPRTAVLIVGHEAHESTLEAIRRVAETLDHPPPPGLVHGMPPRAHPQAHPSAPVSLILAVNLHRSRLFFKASCHVRRVHVNLLLVRLPALLVQDEHPMVVVPQDCVGILSSLCSTILLELLVPLGQGLGELLVRRDQLFGQGRRIGDLLADALDGLLDPSTSKAPCALLVFLLERRHIEFDRSQHADGPTAPLHPLHVQHHADDGLLVRHIVLDVRTNALGHGPAAITGPIVSLFVSLAHPGRTAFLMPLNALDERPHPPEPVAAATPRVRLTHFISGDAEAHVKEYFG